MGHEYPHMDHHELYEYDPDAHAIFVPETAGTRYDGQWVEPEVFDRIGVGPEASFLIGVASGVALLALIR